MMPAINPDEAVAYGAAVQAGILSGEGGQDLLLRLGTCYGNLGGTSLVVYTGVGKCPLLGILNITFKYLLEMKYPLFSWVMFN